MAVLRDDPDRPERRGGAQDGADIMRVGDLVEDEQDCAVRGVAKNFVQPDILERFDFDDHALMRSVVRNEPAEVGRFGKRDLHVLREIA